MQDRFRFRFWDEKALKWFYFGFETFPTYEKQIWEALTDGKKIYQCTGLKDKHGRLIFEGDIVKYFCPAEYCSDGLHKCSECYSGENGSVHYDEDLAMYEYRSKSDECPLTDNINTEEDLEIVGNIYDNPELLKEVK